MESELLELMPDTILIAAPDGTFTERGQANYGSSTSYPCRIEPVKGEVIVRGPNLQERQAKWRILVGTTAAINPAGRLTLPAGFDPQQPPFWAVGRQADEAGNHHVEIYV